MFRNVKLGTVAQRTKLKVSIGHPLRALRSHCIKNRSDSVLDIKTQEHFL